MQDHQPPQPEHWSEKLARIDGSVHADVPAPEGLMAAGYVSVTGLRFTGQKPFRVTDHAANIGTVFIELSPEVSIAVRSEEQARALIVAAGQAAAIFAQPATQRPPRHGGVLR